jgi:lipoprotein-anchoring transpeptidase ErfK/SrfK
MTISTTFTRRSFGALMLGSTAACGLQVPVSNPVTQIIPSFIDGYGPLFDAGYDLPGIPSGFTQGINRRMSGGYLGEAPRNSIDVDPYAKFLYHVKGDGTAVRYPIGVGRAGRSFSGTGVIRLKKKWPGWTPTQNMLRTEPDVYGPFRRGIPGGLRSPLGARALYLFRNGRDTYYRIHGTNDLGSIGNSGSAGCIRMFNQDMIHLYNAVDTGIKVLVRSEAESLRVDPENYNRGIELPAKTIDPDEIYGEEALANDQRPDFDAVDPNAPIEESNVPL